MPVLALLIMLASFYLMPAFAAPNCPGLQGDALERCLKGEAQEVGPRTVVFYGPDDKEHEFEAATVTKSMETVCKGTKMDGMYVAYRTDKGRKSKWKEVTCREGKLEGLWKEYFSDEEITTVLSYDAAGKALMQAVYLNGQLLKEGPVTSPR
jgi:hypothetical protein